VHRRKDAGMFEVQMKLDLAQRGDLWLLSNVGIGKGGLACKFNLARRCASRIHALFARQTHLP
jgi:hypothetical protein